MTEQENPGSNPSPREKANAAEPAQMSEGATLGNIFIEPGRVFDDMRRKPRFLLAGIIILLLFTVFQVTFIEKVGLENIVRARIESSSRTRDLPDDQKNAIIAQQGGPIAKYITYGITPVAIVVTFIIGGLLYWGLSNAMGGSNTFLRGLSVWVYSGFPVTVVFFIGNMIVLFLKSADDIDLANSQNGLLKASLAFFFDPKSSPALSAFLGAFDLFTIWGWILAAIGLQRVAKISSGAAWAVVLILGAVGVLFKVVPALLF